MKNSGTCWKKKTQSQNNNREKTRTWYIVVYFVANCQQTCAAVCSLLQNRWHKKKRIDLYVYIYLYAFRWYQHTKKTTHLLFFLHAYRHSFSIALMPMSSTSGSTWINLLLFGGWIIPFFNSPILWFHIRRCRTLSWVT